jgi:hypothetical protein
MLSALFLISYGVKPNSRLLEAGTKVSSSYVCLPILKKAIHVLLAVEGSEWPHKAGTKLVILFLYMLPSTLDSGDIPVHDELEPTGRPYLRDITCMGEMSHLIS